MFKRDSKLKEISQTYDRSVIPALVATLREFLHLNSALKVLIAATIRNEQTFQAFQNACSGSPHSSPT
jgi:hypothetical protein